MIELGTVYVALVLLLFGTAGLHLLATRYIVKRELEDAVGALACAKRGCRDDEWLADVEEHKVAEAHNSEEGPVTQAELKELRDLVLSLHHIVKALNEELGEVQVTLKKPTPKPAKKPAAKAPAKNGQNKAKKPANYRGAH